MSESTECNSHNFVTEFKKKTKTFIYTWKITNFRDAVTEGHDCLSYSSSNEHDNEKNIFWSVKLYLNGHPDWGTCSGYVQYFAVTINFDKALLADYNYYHIKVSIIDASNVEQKLIHSYKQTSFQLVIPKLVQRSSVLNNNHLLSDGDLTLQFHLTFIKCKLLSNNINNSANFSNMLKFTGLESMFNNKKFSDVKIVIGDTQFYVHKVILAARSPVFAAMFENDMKENIENIVEIQDIDSKIMQELLYFIYTGKVNNIEDVDYDLLSAADKYDIEELRLMCEESLIKQLKVENVITFLIHAEKYRAKILKERALQYFNLHAKEIVQTKEFETKLNSFIDLVPDLFKSLVI